MVQMYLARKHNEACYFKQKGNKILTSPPLATELAASGLFGDIGFPPKLFKKLGDENSDEKL